MSSTISVIKFLFRDAAFDDAFPVEDAVENIQEIEDEPVWNGQTIFALPGQSDNGRWTYSDPLNQGSADKAQRPTYGWHPRYTNKRATYQNTSYPYTSSTSSSTSSSPEATHPGVPYRIERRPLYTGAARGSVSSSSSSGTESSSDAPRTPWLWSGLVSQWKWAAETQAWKKESAYQTSSAVGEPTKPRVYSPKPSRPNPVALLEAMVSDEEGSVYDGDSEESDN